jgi:hypothetical protein
MALQRMAERDLEMETVAILAAFLVPFKNSRRLEVGNNALNSTFGQTYGLRHHPERTFRILSEADQNVCMVREKGPTQFFVCSHRRMVLHDFVFVNYSTHFSMSFDARVCSSLPLLSRRGG